MRLRQPRKKQSERAFQYFRTFKHSMLFFLCHELMCNHFFKSYLRSGLHRGADTEALVIAISQAHANQHAGGEI